MHNKHIKITGILLAGGKSLRMGREKGNIRVGDRFLFQYPLGILEDLCDEILISTCKESSFPAIYQILCDEIEGIGPMGGIYTCLRYSSNDLNVVLSYDMPMVNLDLLRYLMQESQSYDIVLPALRMEKPEPLCGIYRKQTSRALKTLIDKKDYAVHHVLPLVNSRVILINDKMKFWNPDIFHNINREEDLRRLPAERGVHRNEN